MTTTGVHLLGHLEVVGDDGEQVEIGGAQPRAILAMLVAAEGRVVGVDALIDAIWDESPPVSAAGTLQTYVSRLRRALAPIGGAIVRAPAGYRLEIDPASVDVHRFERLADEGRLLLDHGDAAGARRLLTEAEQLWRGPALLEVRDRPRIAGIARRLDDRRLAAIEDRLTADIALGRHAALVAELAQLVAEHPLREGMWELLALARYRSGMQAEALRALDEARATLVDALGVEPGPRLRDLEQAILAHDPALSPAGDAPVAVVQPPAASEGRTALVGRDSELAALDELLDIVAAGGNAVAVVEGEAGVGKTRLVEELAARATGRGAKVVWGRALEGSATPAYWPWLSVLRAVRDERPHRSNDAVDQLLDAAVAAPTGPSLGDRSLLLDGVLRLLDPTDGREPLIVVLEDLQWADAESLALAAHVASGMVTDGVLVVVTLRDGDDARRDEVIGLLATVSRRPNSCRLRLGGLDAHHLGALLQQVTVTTIDEALAAAVHERVDGNPFYAIELQRLLSAQGLVDPAAVATAAIPIGVRDVVRHRLARLPQPTLELLQLASIAGRDIDVGLISTASGRSIDCCLDELDLALQHRLLTDTGPRSGLRFSHALVREVLDSDLSSLRRARLHLTIADALVAIGRSEIEIVAEHLWAAVPIGAGRRAADALDRAAEVAIRRFAIGAATELLQRSLELRRCGDGSLESDAAELDTLVMLVWALRASGGYQAGLDHYPRGIDLARRVGRRDVELEMQWAEWAGYDTACDFERARPVAERFRRWAESTDDPSAKLAGFTAAAIQCWHDGDFVGAAAAFDITRHARSALAPDALDWSLLAELVVLSTGFGLYIDEQIGRLPDPDAAFTATAASVAGNFPQAIVWSFACTSAMSAGDLARVERCARRVLDAESGETLGFWGSQARMYLGSALVATDRADDGHASFAIGESAYLAAGMRTGMALMLAAIGSAEAAAGDLVGAGGHIASARSEIETGERWPTPFVLLAEADLAEASGAPHDEVLVLRQEAESVAVAQGAVVAAARARRAAGGHGWLEAPSAASTHSLSSA